MAMAVAGSRAATVRAATPLLASARATARAAPPAPKSSARAPRASNPASAAGIVRTPGRRCCRPGSPPFCTMSVLTALSRRASSDELVGEVRGLGLVRHRDVGAPRTPAPPARRAPAAGCPAPPATGRRSRADPSSEGRVVDRGRQAVLDRPADHAHGVACPHGSTWRGPAQRQTSTLLEERVVVDAEAVASVVAAGHVVEVPDVGGIEGRLDRREARAGDRRRRQPRIQPRVVRAVDLEVGRREHRRWGRGRS